MYEGYIRKAGNGGAIAAATVPCLVTTTGAAAGDLLHTCPTGRSFVVTKIVWYQATGVGIVMVFGTRNNAAVPAIVPMLPSLLALTGIPGLLTEEEIPAVEFQVNNAVAPLGRDGNLYVVAAAGVLVSVEVAEWGG